MRKLLFIAVLLACATISLQAQVSVIANPSTPDTQLDGIKLSNIYTLVINKWDNGSKIILFDNSTGDVRNSFYTYISKDPMAVKKEWLKKQLMGEGKAPDILGSDSEVISRVASTPGSIGFVKTSSVTDGVKVLLEIK